MPLTVAPLVAFFLGAVLVLVTDAARGDLPEQQARERLVAARWYFGALFFPALLHGALSQPAWAAGYLVRDSVPLTLLVGAAALSAACGPWGLAAVERISKSAVLQRVLVAAIPAVFSLVVLSQSSQRLAHLGTAAAFSAGSERSLNPLVASEFGLSLLLLLGLAALGYVLTVRHVLRLGRPGQPSEPQK